VKTRFVFNPHSGRNRRRPRFAGEIRDFIAAHRLDADLVITEGPGHATELAASAVHEGCETVVAVGGDGTMNEVAQALIGTPAALALVPCGSGNGLALHLGMPVATTAALRLATGAGGRVATIDTGLADGRPFFNAMGLGLDAEVSHRFNRLNRRGLPAYVRTALAAWRSTRGEAVEVTGEMGRITAEALIVAVANSEQYGNNARIAPGARVDDGELDLVFIRPVSLPGAAALAARMFLGNLEESHRVIRMRGARFTVQRLAPGRIHTDGETHDAGASVLVEVNPRSLRVVIPAASRAVGAGYQRESLPQAIPAQPQLP
jgi:YegS/Rv2252/BmrU family lipid kinase